MDGVSPIPVDVAALRRRSGRRVTTAAITPLSTDSPDGEQLPTMGMSRPSPSRALEEVTHPSATTHAQLEAASGAGNADQAAEAIPEVAKPRGAEVSSAAKGFVSTAVDEATQAYRRRQRVGFDDPAVRSAQLRSCGSTWEIVLELHPGAFDSLPASMRKDVVPVIPLLFTQGINEQQSLANAVGGSGSDTQRDINREGLFRLTRYARCVALQAVGSGVLKLDRDLAALAGEIRNESSSAGKRPRVLQLAADITRMLHGLRITCCKSGKDRTGMSVTLEEARLLTQRHGLSPHRQLEVAELLRRHGTRLEICRKNVGRPRYAFNAFQAALLPREYRPPSDTIGGDVHS